MERPAIMSPLAVVQPAMALWQAVEPEAVEVQAAEAVHARTMP